MSECKSSSDCQRLVADEQLNSRHGRRRAIRSWRKCAWWSATTTRYCEARASALLSGLVNVGRRRPTTVPCCGPGADQGPFARRRITLDYAFGMDGAQVAAAVRSYVSCQPGCRFIPRTTSRRSSTRHLPRAPPGFLLKDSTSHRDRHQGGARLKSEGPRRGGALAGRGPAGGDLLA